MVSHSDSTFFRASFNCICGASDSVEGRSKVDLSECEVPCPGGQFKCGDASKDLLRVYCIREECEYPKTDLCGYRKPYSYHGCIQPEDLNWTLDINLKSFNRSERFECIWDCQKYDKTTTLAVTRLIGSTVTCSCLQNTTIQREDVISTKFCSNLELDTSYYVHCSADLNPGEGSVSCEGEMIGCIFSHLFKSNFSASLTGLSRMNPETCQNLCENTLPGAKTVGVRLNPTSRSLECSCSTEYPSSSSLGPKQSCNLSCGDKPCGGNSSHSSYSLYCIPDRRKESGISFQSLTNLEIVVLITRRNVNSSLVFLTFIFIFGFVLVSVHLYINRHNFFY
ncbi:uncharacterized protein LOC111713792 [Eurytemora carolleeae]|uniref:uncharacterized protein LOC111713792 n=1 Tax=Eurytemora carolleeae TaxID=1294199 RepID=UPI000C786905|nr:uncharacterized protein LOC111713792 [Eurytemora carolleeae]|eukprot:XP_023344501.1 uncharacterized protein LOC111713792 [Eurytemora affinis]